MRTAEVLAVEIRQFVGQGVKTLVPRVLGQTAEAQQQKTTTPRTVRHWDEASFFQEVETHRSMDEARIGRAIVAWANAHVLRIWWGKGSQDGSCYPVLDIKERSYTLFCLWTYGKVEVQFQWLKEQPPFADETLRLELLRRLNELPGVIIPTDAIARRPSFPLTMLQNETALQQFLMTFDWVIQEIQAWKGDQHDAGDRLS
jgi:hypothetical protein